MWLTGLLILVVKLALGLVVVLLIAAYLVLIERKLLGHFQLRYGPNRVGWFGVWQPLADGIKLLLKEDITPAGVDGAIFRYAPAVVALVPLLILAVVPFGTEIRIGGKTAPLLVADLNVGLLAVLALASLGVYGVALGGWASGSKYSLLGGLRGAAQMVSYELALGLSLVPVVMLAGSFNLGKIVAAQADYPFILVQPLAFVIFLLGGVAESKRLPFDLPEAENELMAGYHTEYGGMRFALYFLGEYINMITLGCLVAVFFLGGWHGPLLPPYIWFVLKVMLVPLVLIWSRASLPRPRYDQLMAFGWKVLLPAALLNIVVSGAVILWWRG